MAEIIAFETPSKGRSSIDVAGTDRGIILRFKRDLGMGMVVSETILQLSGAQAVVLAHAILDETSKLGSPP